ncbi:dTDP-4-dehydrorhamnose 3,5-epimerase [Chthonobacter albigriseus]|uniref:dTDP-4-dehydrorhamnose 3,5-epimerase n=1 Tax=Chthonobacter albigriseus TaxID=1683161 RepID=UPI0015EF387B|nr:dTDP-4-dehydrorhamnose 3,5-epimerase [Chthonobacter albigriseus]
MNFERTHLADVVLITPKRFADERGWFMETFRQEVFSREVGPIVFVQENHSLSRPKGTVRGLHFQRHPTAQGKLVRCLRGAILDVAVDIRVDSPTFGRHVAETLSAENGRQLWVPVGFAHGFCTLEADTEVAYKVTNPYSPTDDGGILWNDPDLQIDWPVDTAGVVLSAKDGRLPRLRDLPETFRAN